MQCVINSKLHCDYYFILSIYSSTKSMRIDVQRILMKPPIVYMNEGHSFGVFLFNYESNKLFNDFLLLDLVIFL